MLSFSNAKFDQKVLTQHKLSLIQIINLPHHMTTSNQQQLKEQLENLHAHFNLIKDLKQSEQQNEYFVLLQKAQKILGDVSPHIAIFYYKYGSFLLSKIQSTMDLFNQGAIPQAHEEGAIDEYDECYQDDSLDNQNGANYDNEQKKQVVHHDEEKKQKVQQSSAQIVSNELNHKNSGEKVLFEDDCMQITQIDEKLKQKLQQNPNFLGSAGKNGQIEEEEEDMNDLEVCYQNFQAALNIYNREIRKMDEGEQSPLDRNQALKYRFHIHGRLGQLYALDQKYQESIQEFRYAIKFASEFDHPETLRIISEAHFSIGNALLHQAKSNAEVQAIQEYIQSVKCLIKFIDEVQRYDTSKFEIPTMQKPKVDRYQYLRAPKDNDKIADLKEVISMILDKIEDTYQQIGVKSAYEAQKKKIEKQKQEMVFKEVPKDVKVTNLGTFGNRKRTPTDSPATGVQKLGTILTGLNPSAPSESVRKFKPSNEEQRSDQKSNDQIITETQVKETRKSENNDLKVINSDTKDSVVQNNQQVN